MCNRIGIPIKAEKTVYPTTVITIYGIEIDSNKMECRLPVEKIVKLRNALNKTYNRKKIKLRDLQSLIGLLNFACLVVSPGRAFLRRLIDLTIKVFNPFHWIKLTCEARADILAWKCFIESFNGKSMFLPVIGCLLIMSDCTQMHQEILDMGLFLAVGGLQIHGQNS